MRAGTLRRAAMLGLMLSLAAGSVFAADSDKDGLTDAFETKYGVTSPTNWDSDGDGVIDSAEDGDRDRLGNRGEQRSGTDPGKADTDGDGKPDGKEDADGDGRSNSLEQDQRPIPAGLRPALRDASGDRQPDRKRCQTAHGQSRVVSCTFGDPNGSPTVVLVGDSHLTMYLTAYRQIAKARGWKLVTMTKAACPAFLGMHGRRQSQVDKGVTCRKWRRKVIDKLNAKPPDYIVFGHANYRLVNMAGKRLAASKVPEVWRTSVRRTLKLLPAKSEVLVLGPVPYNRADPLACLRRHPKNMSKCTTKAIATADRAIDQAIRAGANQTGAKYATLHDQICSYDPCPVVQGNILMFRDRAHVTETFARRLKPSIAQILDTKLMGGR